MATLIPPGMWLAKLRWRLIGDSEEMISTIGVRGNEPGDREPNDVAHSIFAAWAGAFETDVLNVQWSFVGVDVVGGFEASDPPVQGEGGPVGTYNETLAGAMGAAVLPNNCALLVKKQTAVGGRRNHGRMFIPAGYVGEAEVDGTGLISAGNQTFFQDHVNQFYENLRDSTGTPGPTFTSYWPVLFHSDARDPDGNVIPNTAPPPTDITALVADPRIATQRQRMRR